MSRVPLWRRYARLFGPDPAGDVNDELQFHLEAKVEDLIDRGWKPDAARREAQRQFGDFQAVQKAGERLGKEERETGNAGTTGAHAYKIFAMHFARCGAIADLRLSRC